MGFHAALLAPGETVLHRTRRHWLVLLRASAAAVVLALLALVMIVLYGTGGWSTASTVGLYGGLAMLLVAIVVTLPGWLRWWNEVYLVTDRRVVRVQGVLRKESLDSGLAKVNDVRLEQTTLGRMLGYGTLEIITASESGINRLDFLPRPLEFKRAMMSAAEMREHGAAAPPAGASGLLSPASSPRTTAERLAELDDLHRRQLLSDEEYRSKRAEIIGAL